jgi:DNA repair exonuclease SbcCD ATPase subunit
MAGVSFLVTRARRRKTRRPTPAPAPVPSVDPAALAAAETEFRTLRAEREELEPGLPALESELGPYAQTTAGELARLEENWRLRGDEQLRLRAERQQAARQYLPGGSDGWREQPVGEFPAEVAPLTVLLRAMGEEAPAQCGAFVERLAALDEIFWKKAAAKARTAREEDTRRHEVVAEIERLRAEREGDDEEARIRPLLAPFDENTPEAELRRLLDACAEEEKSLAAAEEQLAASPDAAEVDRRLAEAAGTEQAALAKLREGWAAAPEPSSPVIPWLEHLREEERAARAAWTEDGVREEAVQGVYKSAGARSRDEIQDRRSSADAALGLVVRDLEKLEARDPFFAATRSIEDPVERGRRLQEAFDAEQAHLDEERREAERSEVRERDLLRELAALEGRPAPNVAQLEISIRTDEAEAVRLRREREAVALAFRWVEEAGRHYQGGYREELEQRVSAYFELFTGTPGRRLRLDEKFRVQAVDPDGQVLTPAQLSQGAHDQLFLAVRLAVADLLSGAVELPLFFDDPFLHFDAERLARLREALEKLGARRQWILLTHREEFREWGRPVEISAG